MLTADLLLSTQRTALALLCGVLALGVAACAGDDMGEECPLKGNLRNDLEGAVVAQFLLWPCSGQVCVARSGATEANLGYCSRLCSGSGRGDCPKGWSCNEINQISPEFAGRRICTEDPPDDDLGGFGPPPSDNGNPPAPTPSASPSPSP